MEAGTLSEILASLAALITAASGAVSHLVGNKGKKKPSGPSKGLVILWIVCASVLLTIAAGAMVEKMRPCGQKVVQRLKESQYLALSQASTSLARLGALPATDTEKVHYLERLNSIVITLEYTYNALMVGVEANAGLYPDQKADFSIFTNAGETMQKVIKQLKNFQASPNAADFKIEASNDLDEVLEIVRPKD